MVVMSSSSSSMITDTSTNGDLVCCRKSYAKVICLVLAVDSRLLLKILWFTCYNLNKYIGAG